MNAPAHEPPLTEREIRALRSILRGISPAEWRSLKALASGMVNAGGASGGTPSGGGGTSSGGRPEELPDHFLDSQAWADKIIDKDPRKWAGDSMVGLRYSEAPSEWHDVMASQFAWKADKGRKEQPPRLQTKGKNAGKPWYEADDFNARVCRAWSRRNQGKTLPPPGRVGGQPTGDDDPDGSHDGAGGYEEGDDTSPP